jgi:hypothetical protein
MYQKALSLSLGALAFFGVGLAIPQASSYSSCIAAAQGYGSRKCGCAHRACAATARQLQALEATIIQAGPGGGGRSIRPVLLSEIESQSTISVAQGITLDFSDGGSNNVTVMTSDNPSVVQITSKTNVVTVAPGTAHLRGRPIMNLGMQ